MSTVCVLTPIVVGAWPAIAAAVAGVASSMGYAVLGTEQNEGVMRERPSRKRIETEVANSEVLADVMAPTERIRIQRGDIEVEFGRDERGSLTVCVTGEKHSKAELERVGKEVSGRVVQQFAYHKLVSELKSRNYAIIDESVEKDNSIQVRVRLNQ